MNEFDFKGDGTSKEKDESNWKKGNIIGVGFYGRVYKGTLLENDDLEFAVKEMEFPKDERKLKRVEDEIKILRSLSHVRIVQCCGSCRIDSKVFIFMELMEKGTLNGYIENRNCSLTEVEVRTFTRQILEGVDYLHSKKILHRDLKSQNILLADNGELKIADFGISIEFAFTSNAQSNVGTVRYSAPERLTYRKGRKVYHYSYPSDIWAVGCITVEMISGKLPFSELDDGQIISAVLMKKESPMSFVKETFSSKLHNFMSAIFEKVPERRPSARDLLYFDPFINGGFFQPLANFCGESQTGQLVKYLSKLTVKLFVKKTSRNRPSTALDKENDGRKKRRKTENAQRFGTGIVTAVYETNGSRAIKIATDSSIIYDTIEAENTECTLYYDSLKNKGTVFKKAKFLHSERNISEVEFIMNDRKILLEEDIATFRKFMKESSTSQNTVVMVSHPLGLPVHVSIGTLDESVNVTHAEEILGCPGIKGAPIFKYDEQSDMVDGDLLTCCGICLTPNFDFLKVAWHKE